MVIDPTVTAFELGTWRKIDEIFRQALALDGGERERFLDTACAGDRLLRQRVTSLLELDSETFSVLDRVDAWAQDSKHDPLDVLRDAGAIPGFRLGERLGEGGTSIVFEAEDEDDRLGRRLAIKLLRAPMPSAHGLARFVEEGRILARLDHPSIARIFDAGTTINGLPFLVMERVDGQPIDRYCASRELSAAQRVELIRGVCSAVSYAHGHLVVHRDLKPSNILVTHEGRPKLVDFGIAKLLEPGRTEGETGDGVDLTREHLGPMTPRFASPEQLIGEPVTVASDIFSLGTVLYDLLAGWPPPNTSDTERRAGQAVTERPPKPSATLAGRLATGDHPPSGVELDQVRGDLDVITLHALAPSPAQRYSSADHLADDLRRWSHGYPIEAREPSWRYRTELFLRRHRRPAIAAATALVLLLVLTSTLAVTARALAEERDRARDEKTTAEQATQLLVELFQIAEPTAGRGPTVTARELLDHGVAKLDSGFVSDPETEATLAAELANLYKNLGLYEEALALFERAHRLLVEEFGAADERTLKRHGDVAGGWLEAGEFEPALAEAEAALELCRQGSCAGSPTHSHLLAKLAFIQIRQGNILEADPVVAEALALHRRLPHQADSSAEMVRLLNLQAMTFSNRGDFQKAETQLREALAFGMSTLGYDDPEMFPVRKNLANALSNQIPPDRIGEAEDLLIELLETEKRLFGPGHPRTGFTLNQLAGIYRQQGDLDRAEESARESLRVRSSALGPEHPANGPSLSILSTILYDQGDFDGAEEALRRALAIMEKTWAPNASELAHVLGPLGDLLVVRGRAEEAEPLLRRALQVRRAGLPEGSPATYLSAHRLGACLTKLGKFEEAEALLREAVEGLPPGPGRQSAQSDLDELDRAWGRPAPN